MNVDRWAKLLPWEPTSAKQTLDYLKHMGYPIPKNRKTKKDTTDEEALEKLLRDYPTDPVLPYVLAARRLQKASGYLADTHVGGDARFHPEYTFHPETSRLSARRPSLMNQPQGRKPAEEMMAKAVRRTIKASPGWVLLERDYRAQESLLLGWFAQDQDYMRISRMDNYSFFVGMKVGLPVDLGLSDAEVRAKLSHLRETFPSERKLFKKIILSLGYGEGLYAMARDLEPALLGTAKERVLGEIGPLRRWWKELGADPFQDPRATRLLAETVWQMAKQAATEYRAAYYRAAPKVERWQRETLDRAHRERKLINPFGAIRYFWDAKTKSGKPGAEANKALAFLPQSTGAGILKETLLSLDEELGEDPNFRLLVPIHDAVLAECREDRVGHYSRVMKEIMEAPIPQLGGLRIDTEAKMGADWRGMHPTGD